MHRRFVWDTLLSWKGFLVGKKNGKERQVGPLCLFWIVWKARNKITFKDEIFSTQNVKTSFVFLLWLETNMSILNGLSTIAGFIDWVGWK